MENDSRNILKFVICFHYKKNAVIELVILCTMKNIFKTIIFLIIIVVSLHEGVDMIYVLDAPSCYECREKVRTTRLRIGQNCRAVCTKKSGLKVRSLLVQKCIYVGGYSPKLSENIPSRSSQLACKL